MTMLLRSCARLLQYYNQNHAYPCVPMLAHACPCTASSHMHALTAVRERRPQDRRKLPMPVHVSGDMACEGRKQNMEAYGVCVDWLGVLLDHEHLAPARLRGEKGTGRSGKPLHFKVSTLSIGTFTGSHKAILDFFYSAGFDSGFVSLIIQGSIFHR